MCPTSPTTWAGRSRPSNALLLPAASIRPRLLYRLLCFVDGEWPLFGAPHEFRRVRLEGPRSIVGLLACETALDEAAIGRLTSIFAAALPPR